MSVDLMLDIPVEDKAWGHAMTVDADGLDLHYVQMGLGEPRVLLLHGWPGFWYDWRRVLPLVAQFASVVALDFRGFGFSARPDWSPASAYSAEAQAKNVLTLLDHLQVERVVLVGYDIGSRIAQTLARQAPERVQALVLAAPVYPGYGQRPLEPAAQRERWYQYFHLLPIAEQLIGHDEATVRIYLSHFYDHWVGNKQAVRPKEFDEIVKVYAQPDAARGSIAWYRAGGGSGQLALTSGQATVDPITQPTIVLWGQDEPILPAAWGDRLREYFSDLRDVQFLPGIGHFMPFEAPEVMAEAIRKVL